MVPEVPLQQTAHVVRVVLAWLGNGARMLCNGF